MIANRYLGTHGYANILYIILSMRQMFYISRVLCRPGAVLSVVHGSKNKMQTLTVCPRKGYKYNSLGCNPRTI